MPTLQTIPNSSLFSVFETGLHVTPISFFPLQHQPALVHGLRPLLTEDIDFYDNRQAWSDHKINEMILENRRNWLIKGIGAWVLLEGHYDIGQTLIRYECIGLFGFKGFEDEREQNILVDMKLLPRFRQTHHVGSNTLVQLVWFQWSYFMQYFSSSNSQLKKVFAFTNFSDNMVTKELFDFFMREYGKPEPPDAFLDELDD